MEIEKENKMTKFFRASGSGGFLRGIFVNVLTMAIARSLVGINENLAVVFLLVAGACVGVLLIRAKKFPIYYLLASILIVGLGNLVMFTMAPKSRIRAFKGDSDLREAK